MSDRHEIFVRTELSPAELAQEVVSLVGGEAQLGLYSVLSVDIDRFVEGWEPGSLGYVAGPVQKHESDRPYPGESPFEPGYFEASDAYNIELQLSRPRRFDPPWVIPKDFDAEALAAAGIFCAIARAGHTAIHVYGESLLRAALPGKGVREFESYVSIYYTDADSWEGYVLMP